jgi:hypothetical protein
LKSLYWNTATPLLQSSLRLMMSAAIFDAFRLVRGTSLSLQLGHRISLDIDLFTDAAYGTIDFEAIASFLHQNFSYVDASKDGLIGIGKSYIIGKSEHESLKLDIYYTDPYIRKALIVDNIRLAVIEDIVAMKVDVVQRGGRKKDFWDLHELLDKFSIDEMLNLHAERYPYAHDQAIIRKNFTDFEIADNDFEPVCLQGKYWELIKLDFMEALE